MIRLLFLLLITCWGFSTALQAQQLSKHTVYFEVDKFELTPAERSSLEAFILLEGRSAYISSIRITGHTDADASNMYNEKLSKKRVETVAGYFNQLTDQALLLEWMGEESPLNNNATLEEKRLNRRVEIVIEHATPDLAVSSGNIKDLYKMLEQKKQRFCIHPKGDTTIILDQGTLIYFPAEPFGKLNVPCVEIRAKEFYKVSDMILENLSTTSNGNLLETAGMVYVEAAVNDQLIELSSGKKVMIMMPAETLRSDMEGFVGERDPHTDLMNWQTNPENDFSRLGILSVAPCLDNNRNGSPRPGCARCTLFFCRFGRIDEGIKGMVNVNQRKANMDFRDCQRSLRRNRRSTNVVVPFDNRTWDACAQLDSLFEVYGVNNREDLINAMNKQLMEKYGVKDMTELRDTLRKIELNRIETDLNAGIVDQNDLRYYVHNTSQLGWINTDAFSKLSGTRITMKTDLPYDKQTDCKAAFTGIRGILPSSPIEGVFQFSNVPKNNEIWLIGMRFTDGQAYLSMKKTKTSEKVEMAPFKQVTLDELREELKKLN